MDRFAGSRRSVRARGGRRPAVGRWGLERLERRWLPATLTVNTAADEDGVGSMLSLREAIEVSNGTLAISALSPEQQAQISGPLANPNTIAFNIGSGGPQTLGLLSALPAITSPLTIDGTTQPGYDPSAPSPVITLNGSNAGANGTGLFIPAGNSTVLALSITQFSGSAIYLQGQGGNAINGSVLAGNSGDGLTIDGAPGNSITASFVYQNQDDGIRITGSGATANSVRGCSIGIDQNGKVSRNGFNGIEILNAPDNTIGGTDQAAGNLIAGNGRDGIDIAGAGATGDLLEGNFIGTDRNNTSGIANFGDGVLINSGAAQAVIRRCIISGNRGSGIEIDGSDASQNVVQGNLIGTSPDGQSGQGNLVDGILISGAPGNRIGGPGPGEGNVISANFNYGIEIGLASATGNTVQGNLIGTSLDGESAHGNLLGIIIIDAPGNLIGGPGPGQGNVISGNFGNGIEIDRASATGNTVQGNLIGTDAMGHMFLQNAAFGVQIHDASSNLIGGTTPGARNVISGNVGTGIDVEGDANDPKSVTGNRIEGNYIGTKASGSGLDLTGFAAPFLSNFGGGVRFYGASGNTVGGTDAGARNIISGNSGAGLLLTNYSSGNLVEGNYFGPDVTGADTIGNSGSGVVIDYSSAHNTIGGTTVAARNVITGNTGSGITLQQSANNNVIQGNFIGTDVTGTKVPPLDQYTFNQSNLQDGITLSSFANNNTIGGTHQGEGNLIAGNTANGINFSSSSYSNIVQGNKIGTDSSGTRALGNALNGVYINDVPSMTIGGADAGAGNLISGNRLSGISLFGMGSEGNVLQGNRIGTDLSGTRALGNALGGVLLTGAIKNLVGGDRPSGNLISGNLGDGIAILNDGPAGDGSGNFISGNLIGTDSSGTQPLANSGNGVTITQTTSSTIEGNSISGNTGNGIALVGSSGISIAANFIGTNTTGTGPIANGNDGVLLDAAAGNTVGSTVSGAGNLISGNSVAGVEIQGPAATGNLVVGNTIGPDDTGTAELRDANGRAGNLVGVYINNAPGNTVGGTATNSGNLISGNSRPDASGIGIQILGLGAAHNQVVGNYIGTDRTGTRPLGNDTGVFITGAPGNTIGGSTGQEGNIISGNGTIGVHIFGSSANGNKVQANFIGVDFSGRRLVLPGPTGLGILVDSTNGTNIVGGVQGTSGNVIAGLLVGVEIYAPQSPSNPNPGSIIEGNLIGTDSSGEVVLGNTEGIFINGVPRNTIGGTTADQRNIISGNDTGIYLLGSTAANNVIEGNYVGLDAAGAVPEGNHVGIYLDGATANLIGGPSAVDGNVIAGNKMSGNDGATGILFFNGAARNVAVHNFIGTDAFGKSGKGFGQGDYGVLLFNAANNQPSRLGSRTNRILGSGIAAIREFTGSANQRPARVPRAGAKSSGGAKHRVRVQVQVHAAATGWSVVQPEVTSGGVTGAAAGAALRPKR
jgi:parallel beta-helix repeat protein